MKLFVLGIAILMYAAVIMFNHKKSWVTLGAAVIVILAGMVGAGDNPAEYLAYINWNVLLIYIGSLVIAELFIYSRVPAYIADMVIDKTPSLGIGIVIILVLTGLISAFVENVATVLVMAPVALEICRRLKISPVFFLFGLAVMANLQGTATLVGDPPSMIFAAYAGYSFNDFFMFAGKPSIFFAVELAAAAGAVYFYFYFRKYDKVHMDIPVVKIISLVPTLLLVLLIGGLAAISFLFHDLAELNGIWCFALGLVGLAWFIVVRKETVKRTWGLVKGLDWDTIFFLIGIFVVIGAISKVGLLEDLSRILEGFIGSNVLLGFIMIVLISVIISGFVDNVPYIIVMLPVAATLAKDLSLAPELYMFALLVGSCMGGNLTPFGASANVVTIGILKKEGFPTRFADWLKTGIPFTLITTATASVFIWFIWS